MTISKESKLSKRERTIKKILRVTERLIKEKGYAKVSNNQIAKESGVSIGLLYKYFRWPKYDLNIKPSIREKALLLGKPVIIHELIKNSIFVRGFASIKNEKIKARFEDLQKLSDAQAKSALIDFFLFFIKFHRRKKSIITALEIAYLSDKKIFKNFDLDYFYQDLVDAISSLLVFIGRENDIQLSKLLFNTFNNIVIRHVIFGEITKTDEQLADFLSDLLISYIKSIGGDRLFE